MADAVSGAVSSVEAEASALSKSITDIFSGIDLTDPIKAESKVIGEQVSNIKDTTLNAVNTGASAIKKGVATLNGLDSQMMSTISGFQSDMLGKLNSLLTSLSGGLLNAADFTSLITGQSSLKLTLSNLLDKISSMVGFDVTNIKGFATNFENKLLSQLNSLTGGYLGLYADSEGKVLRVTSNTSATKTQQIMDTLGRVGVGGYADTFNYAVKNSFYNSLLDQATYTGVVDAYGPIAAMYNNTDDADRALVDSMGTAITNGDAVSLAELGGLVSGNNANLIAATYPNGASDLTKYFKLPSYATAADYADLSNTLWGACVSLGGDNWWKIYTEIEGWVPNLLIGSLFSDDVLKVWIDRDEVIPLIACRNRFKQISGRDAFLADFPQTPVSP